MSFKIYKVGGCVRDEIMGILPKDIDYVIVGADEKDLLKLGFQKIDADFPVFLKNGCEYALARTERKNGKGYLGFDTNTKNVSLEEDLKRRDFTINSIAKADDGSYIDPFNGIQDIKKRVLRNTSDAFVEDPIRILRLARFRARFGFNIDTSTKKLVLKMKNNNLLNELKKVRVYIEIKKVFQESSSPSIFFTTLLELNVLDAIFEFLNSMIGVKQNKKYHEEDLFTHTIMSINELQKNSNKSFKIFIATLLHDIGKLKDISKNHENKEIFLPLLNEAKNKLNIPNTIFKFCKLSCEFHRKITNYKTDPKMIIKLFDKIQNKNDLIDLCYVSIAQHNGRILKNLKPIDFTYFDDLFVCFDTYNQTTSLLKDNNFKNGLEIKDFLYKMRLLNIQKILDSL